MIEKQIKELGKKYFKEVQAIRRHVHQHPEIGYNEFDTSALIKEKLTALDIPFTEMAKTGVVGLITGKNPGKTVLLRADMDALPITETADVEYCSLNKGVMHACGHDGHVAGLLGAAMILNELKDELSGNVKLMFQPAEETSGGAEPMIKAGILENPKVDAAFGLHVWGSTLQGKAEVKHNEMMASPDAFKIKIIGKGGHAAMPNLCIDPINIAVQAIASMQNILTRTIDPIKPAVLSFCSIHAGDAYNVIPQEIVIKGSIRSFHPDVRKTVPEQMQKILKAICDVHGASFEYKYIESFPPLVNDNAMTDLAQKAIAKVMGAENVSELSQPNMGGEDFAYLCKSVPSAFFFLGIKPEQGIQPVHHHPSFQWDDSVLENASMTLAQIAVDFLATK